jgi:hypothetical protein
MKKNLLIKFILLFYPGLILSGESIDCQILVDHNAKIGCDLVRPALELKPTNKTYNLIESEISKISCFKDESDEVSLDDNKSSASTLYETVSQIVSRFVKTAKIDTMPKLVLYTGPDSKTYNASAQISTLTQTETVTKYTKNGKKISTDVNKKVKKFHKLVIGQGLLKLLLWKTYGNRLLSCIIAHEIGHMCDSISGESKRAEYFADSKAIELVGKGDAYLLTQAIDMITLAGHMYSILTLNSDLLRLNLGDAHQVIRIIVNSMVNELPELGDLGQCSTHKKFGYVVNKVFQDSVKYSLDPKIGMTEKEFGNVYHKLHRACLNLAEYIGPQEEQEISQKYEFIENYTNQIYNHITHPTPLERSTNIYNCISRLA